MVVLLLVVNQVWVVMVTLQFFQQLRQQLVEKVEVQQERVMLVHREVLVGLVVAVVLDISVEIEEKEDQVILHPLVLLKEKMVVLVLLVLLQLLLIQVVEVVEPQSLEHKPETL
jgi:hypothetical protein